MTDWDVIIVGSGAGGGAAAYVCARAGLRTLVLEKGKQYSRADYTHDELSEVRRNFFVPYLSDEPRTFRADSQAPAQPSNLGWIACCVGGGTVHWSGFSYRFAPEDFANWPIGYDELLPYYEEAEQLLGVNRSLRVHPFAREFREILAGHGIVAEQTPRAILNAPQDDRKECAYCERCGSYGCSRGAKGSSQEALLAPALRTGFCTIWPEAMVSEILYQGSTASGVRILRPNGQREEVRGRVIIVAASAIESARLLLLSNLHSPWLGRGLTFLSAAFAEAFYDRPQQNAEFFDVSVRTEHGVLNFGTASRNPIHRSLGVASVGPLWGRSLVRQLDGAFRGGLHLTFEGYTECETQFSNAIELDPDERDKYGLPVARITFKFSDKDYEKSSRLAAIGIELFRRTGAKKISAPQIGEPLAWIQGGTCRLGTSPDSSVVDVDGRLHNLSNVYVVDGSVFVTSGKVPGTLNLLGNSLRIAHKLVEKMKANSVAMTQAIVQA